MKYYNGYPEELLIDGRTITLHDVERAMLSLYWDKNIRQADRNQLMDTYKEARMQWLDSCFVFTEADRRRLHDVEQLYLDALRRLENVCRRLTDGELAKSRRGEKNAARLLLHLEVWNLEDTPNLSYTDEDCDLWDVFFGEDRDFDPYWGIVCESVYIDEERQTSSHYSRFLGSYAPSLENQASQETQPGAFSADFLHLKKHYKVSWQDLLKISRFNLTVDVSYA